ncbi:MAG: hypothetical protein R3C05_06775 [Pirellulaceae bacterium]
MLRHFKYVKRQFLKIAADIRVLSDELLVPDGRHILVAMPAFPMARVERDMSKWLSNVQSI